MPRKNCIVISAVVLATIIISSAVVSRVSAADSDLDVTFGVGGKVTLDFFGFHDDATAVAVQFDGKIIVVGEVQQAGGDSAFALARLGSDGTLDPSFGTGGMVTADPSGMTTAVRAVAIQSDGKIVAVGHGSRDGFHNDFTIARYEPNGDFDVSFGVGGVTTVDFIDNDDHAAALAIQPDGKIVVGGKVQGFPIIEAFALTRLNVDGTVDSSFGTNGRVTTSFTGTFSPGEQATSRINAIALQADGKIIAAGTASRTTTAASDFALARYNPDGSPDTSFGTAGKLTTDFTGGIDETTGESDQAYGAVIQADGKIVVAGRAVVAGSGGDFGVVRYNADGSLDSTFGTGGKVTTAFLGNEVARAVGVQADGKIVVAGHVRNSAPTYDDFGLARYSPDGTLDPTFGVGGKVSTHFFPRFSEFDQDNEGAHALAIEPGGKIVAAGATARLARLDFAIARYNVTFDTTAPVTTAASSPAPNPAGWNRTSVEVALTATDDSAGVREITYLTSGAQILPQTVVAGSFTSLIIDAEGETVVTFYATDKAGNAEEAQTLVVKLDKSAPALTCGAADALWHANDVAIPCTATDSVSGLAAPADASFNLITSVVSGTEADDAATGSREICDTAGNCAVAGPVGRNKVDKKRPEINVSAPSQGSSYLLGQMAAAQYDCSDGGSGVDTCVGTAANGSPLDTASVGIKTFAVTAADLAGNSASKTLTYTVSYNVCPVFDQTKAYRSGSTVPVRLMLCDATGFNVSSSSVTVTTLGAVSLSDYTPGEMVDGDQADPENDFRFTGDRYAFNLRTTGLSAGAYALLFRAAGDPIIRAVQFQIK
jgi:uncharacterized delta-60 repeat protein